MRALTWRGRGDVRAETLPDPRIEQPTHAVTQATSQRKEEGCTKVVLDPET